MRLHRQYIRSVIPFVIGIIAAMIGALIVITETSDPSTANLTLLILFMTATGIITLTVSYIVYQRGLTRWFRSLRWALLFTVALTVALIFVNVWVMARLMFINYQDLSITTALLFFAGLTAIAFGFFVTSTITDSIMELAGVAERVAQGDLSARMEVRGNDELARLTETFNWMASNLQEIDQQKRDIEQTRRNLIAWVSHDLRTPLTSMRVMIEALQDGVVTDPDEVARYLDNTKSEIENLSRLITDLFELAQIDIGHVRLNYQHASLCDMISDTIGSMMARANSKSIRLSGKVSDRIDPVHMAPDKIQRVLYNLIDNAIEHTPQGGSITLNAYCYDDLAECPKVRVDVHNTGEGLDTTTAAQVFTSFYRGEKSRARGDRKERGAGLGLAISRGFIQTHGGEIWLENTSAPTGIRFSFTLPRNGRATIAPTQPTLRAIKRTAN